MLYVFYVLLSIGFFYIGFDIMKNRNLYKYVGGDKEKIENINGFEGVCKAFGKIPMVAGGVALSGVLLASTIGLFSLMLTLGMLLVVGFIWANSTKTLKNL